MNRGLVDFTPTNDRLLPIVLIKKHKMLRAVLVFCQKSAKIMLIFFKSTRGLHKNAHFFPIFLNIKCSHSFIFFHRLMAEHVLELSLPWLADFHCSSMTT